MIEQQRLGADAYAGTDIERVICGPGSVAIRFKGGQYLYAEANHSQEDQDFLMLDYECEVPVAVQVELKLLDPEQEVRNLVGELGAARALAVLRQSLQEANWEARQALLASHNPHNVARRLNTLHWRAQVYTEQVSASHLDAPDGRKLTDEDYCQYHWIDRVFLARLDGNLRACVGSGDETAVYLNGWTLLDPQHLPLQHYLYQKS